MSIELAKKRAQKFFQYHNLTLPVNVEKILSSYAIIEETFIPIAGDAICVNRNDKPHIIIKSNMSPYRKRFTYAHELAHLQIPSHTGMISCITEFSDSIDMNSYYEMEQEANSFAAELLMPSDWLTSLITKHNYISDLIKHVVEKANVSFSAAVYNVLMVLPSTYMFIIYNKIDEYGHIKNGSQSKRPLIMYTDDHYIDGDWLQLNCSSHEKIENDVIDVSVFCFKPNLNMEKIEVIANKFSNKDSCISICNKLVTLESISFAHFFKELILLLPSGFIIKLKCIDSGNYEYLYSSETYTRPDFNNDDELDYWLTENCVFHTYSYGKKIELNVWLFNTSFNIVGDPNDKREAKIILRNIINNLYYDSTERSSMSGRVNGIIGSLNGSVKEFKKQQFYDILKQKFNSRTDLLLITNHQDFNQYLYNKVEELYKKRK